MSSQDDYPLEAVDTVWRYLQLVMDADSAVADALFVMGSNDLRVAERAAEVFLQGNVSWLIFSGGLGFLTKGAFPKAEADMFADIALAKGVPAERILIENKSTNSGENCAFTQELLRSRDIGIRSIIVLQKTYMERRAYATVCKQWPDVDVVAVGSPRLTFKQYLTKVHTADMVINAMVGDLQRIVEYPKKGFQIEQEVPSDVIAAWKVLVDAGYTEHLL
eukprot:m.13272 g.13272  ORF g.13272 m.13272 type:complete len:220 (+) comp10132_c0_seq2:37-696(+)